MNSNGIPSLQLIIEQAYSWQDVSAAYLPRLGMVLLFVLTGWLLAKITKKCTIHASHWLNKKLGAIKQRFGLQRVVITWPITNIVSHVLYWFVFLFFLSLAAKSMGWLQPEIWLSHYFPRIFSVSFLLITGYLVIDYGIIYLNKIIQPFLENNHTRIITKSIKYVFMLALILTVLEIVGLNTTLFSQLFILISGVFLSFSLLMLVIVLKDVVVNHLAISAVKKRYHIGQIMSVSHHKGKIIDFDACTVILEQEEKIIYIPAVKICDNIITINNDMSEKGD